MRRVLCSLILVFMATISMCFASPEYNSQTVVYNVKLFEIPSWSMERYETLLENHGIAKDATNYSFSLTNAEFEKFARENSNFWINNTIGTSSDSFGTAYSALFKTYYEKYLKYGANIYFYLDQNGNITQITGKETEPITDNNNPQNTVLLTYTLDVSNISIEDNGQYTIVGKFIPENRNGESYYVVAIKKIHN